MKLDGKGITWINEHNKESFRSWGEIEQIKEIKFGKAKAFGLRIELSRKRLEQEIKSGNLSRSPLPCVVLHYLTVGRKLGLIYPEGFSSNKGLLLNYYSKIVKYNEDKYDSTYFIHFKYYKTPDKLRSDILYYTKKYKIAYSASEEKH
jgi:hypothetical protein